MQPPAVRRPRPAAIALAAALLAAPCVGLSDETSIERARYLMGTLCFASTAAGDTARASAALNDALDEIARLERVMSLWGGDSELARFNRDAAERVVDLSSDLAAVLDSALFFARMTGGAFDPTIEPLARAWDLRGAGRVPDAQALAEARARVGWSGVVRGPGHPSARLARAGMGIDLDGIGKGFALDRARERLARAGARKAMINLGGELATLGGPHLVTVADPARRLRPVLEVAVTDASVSTSGQTERSLDAGGTRIGHVLDPRSGRPVSSDATVTVFCASATRADALSTALLVMGLERAGSFAGVHPDVGVLWLEPAGDTVRAWQWNLSAVRVLQGSAVRWMNGPLSRKPEEHHR